jgi:hypothetical protein
VRKETKKRPARKARKVRKTPPNLSLSPKGAMEGELEHLTQLQPTTDTYLGMPFVMRVTGTNMGRHTMVHFLPNISVCFHLNL